MSRDCTKKRGQLINELLSSENLFGQKLDLISVHFFQPMRNGQIVSCDEFQIIFSNFADLHRAQKLFLDSLLAATDFLDRPSSYLSPAFQNLLLFHSVFEEYSDSFLDSSILVYKLQSTLTRFRTFCLTVARDPDSFGLEIQSLLAAPLHRFRQYKILLEQIVLNTWEDLKDASDLSKFVPVLGNLAEKMKKHGKIAADFIDVLRVEDRFHKGNQLNFAVPGRKLIRSGKMKKLGSRLWTFFDSEVEVILFNDLLVYGKFSPRRFKLTLIEAIPLSPGFSVQILTDSARSPNHRIQTCIAGKTLEFYSQSVQEIQSWSHSFNVVLNRMS